MLSSRIALRTMGPRRRKSAKRAAKIVCSTSTGTARRVDTLGGRIEEVGVVEEGRDWHGEGVDVEQQDRVENHGPQAAQERKEGGEDRLQHVDRHGEGVGSGSGRRGDLLRLGHYGIRACLDYGSQRHGARPLTAVSKFTGGRAWKVLWP